MPQEPEDESNNGPEDRSNDSGSNGSGSMRHNRHRRPELFPRHTNKGISFSELNCLNIDQIVEMLEKIYDEPVEFFVFDPGRDYGFVVNNADVGKTLEGGNMAVNIESWFYSFDASAFISDYCGKRRHLLRLDCVLSYVVTVNNTDLVNYLTDKENDISDIFRVIYGIDTDFVVSLDKYRHIPDLIQRYQEELGGISNVLSLLQKPSVSLLSKKLDYSKASS